MRNKNSSFLLFLIFLTPLLAGAESDQEKKLFEFMNSERLREQRIPFLWDDELYRVALAHSKDMASTGKASHKGRDGREPHERIREANIYASKTGENIARDLNVISAHTLLMQSVYHRENILDPEYTHATVAIVKEKQFLYITQLFMRKIGDYSLQQARETLLKQYGFYRQDKNMPPLMLSEALSNAAQAHAVTQQKLDSFSPMLTMSSIARSNKGATKVTVYTTTSLMEIPSQVRSDLEAAFGKIGIGYQRVQGSICSGGCYLIVLVFG